MRSIVRRDTGESYQEFLTGLAQTSGIATPTRADLARWDRKRQKRTSNQDWKYTMDPDAKIANVKDSRTHLAYKAEHAVDLETGAWSPSPCRTPTRAIPTIIETVIAAVEQSEDAQAEIQAPQPLAELIADKSCHSNQIMIELAAIGLQSNAAEADRGRLQSRARHCLVSGRGRRPGPCPTAEREREEKMAGRPEAAPNHEVECALLAMVQYS
jgi:transposase